MPTKKKLVLGGKPHKYVRSKKLKSIYGYHIAYVPGNKRSGIIAVEKGLTGKIELDTNIHEMLHACAHFGAEEWVDTTAREIAEALWQLGYRKIDEITKTPEKNSK